MGTLRAGTGRATRNGGRVQVWQETLKAEDVNSNPTSQSSVGLGQATVPPRGLFAGLLICLTLRQGLDQVALVGLELLV